MHLSHECSKPTHSKLGVSTTIFLEKCVRIYSIPITIIIYLSIVYFPVYFVG